MAGNSFTTHKKTETAYFICAKKVHKRTKEHKKVRKLGQNAVECIIRQNQDIVFFFEWRSPVKTGQTQQNYYGTIHDYMNWIIRDSS